MTSHEVLIYLQTIKNYLSNNIESREYFMGNGDSELFFEKLKIKSENNFIKRGDPKLTKEDFEELRESFINKPIEKKEVSDNVFQNLKDFGTICLN